MTNDVILQTAGQVFDTEIEALRRVQSSLGESFCEFVRAVTACRGRVILCGVGKSGHIAHKIAATLASLGTPAFFLHPAEALHGDLGMVTREDIVILIGHSGESDEVVGLIPSLRVIGARVFAVSGNAQSTVVRHSDCSIVFPAFDEACLMRLAPTSSTTASLVTGDAIAVAAARIYGLTETDYGVFHPAGALGKKIVLKVADIMSPREECAAVSADGLISQAIERISRFKHGLVVVEDEHRNVLGVFSDGDLRRQMEQRVDIYAKRVGDVMTRCPHCIPLDTLAAQALNKLREWRIFAAPVLDDAGAFRGIITLQDIISGGVG